MALINFCGFETGNAAHEGIAQAGTFSVVTSPVRTGTYAGRVNPGVSGTGFFAFASISSTTLQEADASAATAYGRFYFRAATLPNSTQGWIMMAGSRDNAASNKWRLEVSDTGLLRIKNTGATVVETTAASWISTNTWYLIEVKIGTGTSTTYEVRVNGVTVLSGSGFNTNTNNHARFQLGTEDGITNGSIDFYYDDFAWDDANWLGPGRVKRLVPTANGSTASWTSGTAPSDYTVVDEIPAVDTDYLQCANTSGDKVHLVDVTDAAAAAVSGIVNGVKAWARVRENSNSTSSTKLRIRCNGTDSTTSGVNHSTTVSNRYFLRTTDPSDSAPFSMADIDDLEVGVVESNAVAVRCTVLSAFVDFNDEPCPGEWPRVSRSPSAVCSSYC